MYLWSLYPCSAGPQGDGVGGGREREMAADRMCTVQIGRIADVRTCSLMWIVLLVNYHVHVQCTCIIVVILQVRMFAICPHGWSPETHTPGHSARGICGKNCCG